MNYDQYKKLIQAFSDPATGTIYHYTTADGVAGIIDKHEIWMSNTAFMNDSTELKMLSHSKDLFKDSDFINETVREEWHKWLATNKLFKNKPSDYYMASFSKEKDLLEQWRAYGNFCIGFDAKKLSAKKRVELYRCLYTENEIRKWILKKEKLDKWNDLDSDLVRKPAAFNLFDMASMKYKNKHFKTEKEVRLITVSYYNWTYYNSPEIYGDDFPIHFRTHPVYGFPIPYVKLFLEDQITSHSEIPKESEDEMKGRKLKEEDAKPRKLLPITEVIIGPMARQKEAKAACEILLSERGYKNVQVIESAIPYRGI